MLICFCFCNWISRLLSCFALQMNGIFGKFPVERSVQKVCKCKYVLHTQCAMPDNVKVTTVRRGRVPGRFFLETVRNILSVREIRAVGAVEKAWGSRESKCLGWR